MKKTAMKNIANPERGGRRTLRLTQETVRLLRPEALAQAMSGCDTTSWSTQAPQATVGC